MCIKRKQFKMSSASQQLMEDALARDSCPVCRGTMGGKAARAVSYGGVCCLSCRAFFRRAHQNSRTPNFLCLSGGNCPMSVQTRRRCPKCRLIACIASGMKPELVLTDSQKDQRFRHARARRMATKQSASIAAASSASSSSLPFSQPNSPPKPPPPQQVIHSSPHHHSNYYHHQYYNQHHYQETRSPPPTQDVPINLSNDNYHRSRTRISDEELDMMYRMPESVFHHQRWGDLKEDLYPRKRARFSYSPHPYEAAMQRHVRPTRIVEEVDLTESRPLEATRPSTSTNIPLRPFERSAEMAWQAPPPPPLNDEEPCDLSLSSKSSNNDQPVCSSRMELEEGPSATPTPTTVHEVEESSNPTASAEIDLKVVLLKVLDANLSYFDEITQVMMLQPKALIRYIGSDDREALFKQNRRLFLNFVFAQYLTASNNKDQLSWLKTPHLSEVISPLAFSNLDDLVRDKLGLFNGDRMFQEMYLAFAKSLSSIVVQPDAKKVIAEAMFYYPGTLNLNHRLLIDQKFHGMIQKLFPGKSVPIRDVYEACQTLEAMSVLLDHGGLAGQLNSNYSKCQKLTSGNPLLPFSSEEELWLMSMKDRVFKAMSSVPIGTSLIQKLANYVFKGIPVGQGFGKSAKYVYGERFWNVFSCHSEFNRLPDIRKAKMVASSQPILFALVCARLDGLPMREQGKFILSEEEINSSMSLQSIKAVTIKKGGMLSVRTRDAFPELAADYEEASGVIRDAVGQDADGTIYFALAVSALWLEADQYYTAISKLKRKYEICLARKFGDDYESIIKPTLAKVKQLVKMIPK